ncbi:MAG: aminotransferase class I/II-fold pyridoxal phosphate-dependent enzyme, partial [Propionibacterium sp.]|nr:aminotransferase class I/II-fold pyridoxal phosphate-dependent enzyme [Propionibacterium sp.]
MPQISALVRSVPPSGIRRIFELSATMDDAIKLSVGEPRWEVFPHIREAAAAAWMDDFTGYTHNSGILPLREAIVDKLARANGYVADVERVHVTAGGSQALHLAMVVTLSPGEEVLIPDPGYSTFAMAPRLVGAVPVPYPLRARDSFMPDIDALEALVTPRTRAIVVNSPSNPLGVVYPRAVMQALVDFAARRDLWVISDEVYEALTYDPGFTSAAALDPDRVIGVYSLSKTYALTGGRIGYLTTPAGLAERVRAAQETIASCVNAPAQVAALAALTGPQDMVAESRAHYLANRAAASALR